jgi:hypothetical protein
MEDDDDDDDDGGVAVKGMNVHEPSAVARRIALKLKVIMHSWQELMQ